MFKQGSKRNLSVVKQLLIFRRLLQDIVGADGTVHAGEETMRKRMALQANELVASQYDDHLRGFLVVSSPWQAFTAFIHLSDTYNHSAVVKMRTF